MNETQKILELKDLQQNLLIPEHYRGVIDLKKANDLYDYLVSKVPWMGPLKESSIESYVKRVYRITSHNITDPIAQIIFQVINSMKETLKLKIDQISGIQLNWYPNGKYDNPMHIHRGHTQLVISLGTTRKLQIQEKIYALESGDVIIFGSQIHGALSEPQINTGRISIALFIPQL